MTLHTRIVMLKSRRQKSWSNGQPEIFSAALFLIKTFIDTNAFSIRSNRTVHKAQHVLKEICTSKLTALLEREVHSCN